MLIFHGQSCHLSQVEKKTHNGARYVLGANKIFEGEHRYKWPWDLKMTCARVERLVFLKAKNIKLTIAKSYEHSRISWDHCNDFLKVGLNSFSVRRGGPF